MKTYHYRNGHRYDTASAIQRTRSGIAQQLRYLVYQIESSAQPERTPDYCDRYRRLVAADARLARITL